MRVFAYGSLMFPSVWRRVTGADHAFEPGVADGYSVRAIRGVPWPAIVPDPAASAPGVLWSGVDGETIRRLDRFEGDFYVRRSIAVRAESGVTEEAWAYLAALPDAPDILPDAWDPGEFARHHLDTFGESVKEADAATPPRPHAT